MTTVYGDLVRYRELFGNLFRRDVQAKYRGSLLGLAWTLANPVLLMAVYLLVFSVLWNTPFGSEGHYGLFLLVGLSAWIFFATSVQAASRSMLDNANLIRKTRFPRQLLPLSIVATHLLSFAVMLVVLLVLNFALLPRVRATEWLALPIGLALVAFTCGLALAIASLNVLFRDLEFLVSALLLPLFFLTPVLYPLNDPPDCPAGLGRQPHPLGESARAADRGVAGSAVLRPFARARGHDLHGRCRGRLAGARRVCVQPRRRPDRSRSLIRAS